MATKSTDKPAASGEHDAPTAAVETTPPQGPGFAAAVAQEYGQYIANGPLTYFGAPAFAAGQPVPASHPNVPLWLEDGSIRRADDDKG